MPVICKTKDEYLSQGFQFIENPDGTVSLFNNLTLPSTEHETKPCCEALGYIFDLETQKCRWVENVNAVDYNDPFKVILNPEGNSSTLFRVEENETCSLEVSFDYIFLFKCDDLITAKAKALGVEGVGDFSSIDIQNQIDITEAKISRLTNERDFYQDLVDNAVIPPFVVECADVFPTNNYCLTDKGEEKFYELILTLGTGNTDGLDEESSNFPGAQEWSNSNGSKTEMYNCEYVDTLVSLNNTAIASGNPPLIEGTCNYSIYDRSIALTTKQENQTTLDNIKSELTTAETELSNIKASFGVDENNIDTNCSEYINMFENFDTSFTVEVLGPSGTALTTVYEEDLITIGTGNLYSYIDSSSGKTGILISGDTRLMPTLEETELFDLSADLCSQIRDTLVTDIFDQYLTDNPFPSTEEEKRKIFKKLTEWYQSSWLEYKTIITDENVISLLENKEINISVSINNTCTNFSILLDRIKMNKVCTKVDNVKKFISEPPKFELNRIPDNQKSWLANIDKDFRYSNLRYRGTEYNTNHHKLVVNTKEVDLTLSPSKAVEQDVWCYISDNNSILEGCMSSGDTYSAFTCPSGYTLDTDGNSCTKLTTTGVTTSATTYTIGPGVGLTRPVHYLSRGTIFIEDITEKAWPIYWTGTTKDSWVGPYYNSDYLVDSSGNYLNHTGFGSNTFTDGSLDYVSPDAFSGIKSEYGKSNSSIYSSKLNPNILWGGTDGSVSGTPYVNISNTDNAGRLLNASIWSTGLTPSNEWIGVSYCLELTETKVYRLGFAGDDDVRVKVNGKYIFNSTTTPSHDINIHKNFSASYSRTAQSYLVVGVSLPSGKNIIEVEGYNTIVGVSGFVLEVYDATEAQLKNMRYETELNSVRVFSTADRIGQTFDLGEQSANSCPTGYAYDNCNPGSTSCVLIERTFRETEQLDEYCPCPTYPLIVKDYSGTTIELPLTASTTTFDCASVIPTIVSNAATTLESVNVIKGGSAYALGQRTATTFDGVWITEENDGTVGLYDVDYTAGTNHSYENVSSQVGFDCCTIIQNVFTADTKNFQQGVDIYPSISWDNNKKKCVYRKCGDSGCIDLDEVLTTELSAIDTVKEFASTLSSELIDVKNRKTLSGYPTLRMLYDRYNTRSEEFCGNLSSEYDYSDMDKFGQTVGNYWIDLIEQVVPATTIWGSTYTYKNTVFDQQKFNYRNSNTYFCDDPNPPPAVTFKPFDFLRIKYKFTSYVGGVLINGDDLDTRTYLLGTGDPNVDGSFIINTSDPKLATFKNTMGYGPPGQNSAINTYPYPSNPTLVYQGDFVTGSTGGPKLLRWGKDNTTYAGGSEDILVDFKAIATQYSSTTLTDFFVELRAFWCQTPGDYKMEVEMTTWTGGAITETLSGPYGTYYTYDNPTGTIVDNVSFKAKVSGPTSCASSLGDLLGQVKYDSVTGTATLIPATGAIPGIAPPGTPYAKDETVSVIIKELPKPTTLNPDGTVSLSTIQPSIKRCNGVYLEKRDCDSQFLGTVKEKDNLTGNITTI